MAIDAVYEALSPFLSLLSTVWLNRCHSLQAEFNFFLENDHFNWFTTGTYRIVLNYRSLGNKSAHMDHGGRKPSRSGRSGKSLKSPHLHDVHR